MKVKRAAYLLTMASVLSSGCAHWSDQQKRIAAFTGGLVLGAGIGSIAAKSAKGSDASATALAYGAAGSIGGFIAGESLFPGSDGKELSRSAAEVKKYQEMDRNEGRLLLFDALVKGPSRVKCPGGSTSEAAQIFCTDSMGELGNCQDLGFRYISSELAVAFVGYYSPNGCYPPPYSANPGLKQYFKPLIEQARGEFKK